MEIVPRSLELKRMMKSNDSFADEESENMILG